MMMLCPHCMAALESRGEMEGAFRRWAMDAEESENTNTPCEWCDEFDDLYQVVWNEMPDESVDDWEEVET